MINVKKILISVFVFLVLVFIALLVFNSKIINNRETEVDLLMESNQGVLNDYDIVSDLRIIDKDDIVIGSNNSKVEIIVYEDLSDIYSITLNETLKKIIEFFPEDVVIAYRPYANKIFPSAIPVYLLAECAREQGKFFEARNLILQKLANKELSEDDFIEYGLDLSLDSNNLNKCLRDKRYVSKIENLTREAEGFGVYGSPVTFVNKEIVVGARSFDDVINGNGEELLGMKNIILRYLEKSFDANNDISNNQGSIEDNVAFCTMDAMICPDGSYVGRDGSNNCEFFPCPEE